MARKSPAWRGFFYVGRLLQTVGNGGDLRNGVQLRLSTGEIARIDGFAQGGNIFTELRPLRFQAFAGKRAFSGSIETAQWRSHCFG